MFCFVCSVSDPGMWFGSVDLSSAKSWTDIVPGGVTQQEDKHYLNLRDTQQRERKQKKQFLPSSSAPLGTHAPTSASSVKWQGNVDNRDLLFWRSLRDVGRPPRWYSQTHIWLEVSNPVTNGSASGRLITSFWCEQALHFLSLDKARASCHKKNLFYSFEKRTRSCRQENSCL